VLITFDDQKDMVMETALASGVPQERFLNGPRDIPGHVGVDTILEPLLDALIRPLTEEEMQGGRWEPPPQERVLFEGTLDEADAFYQQTREVFWAGWAPIAVYTDGLPIRVPTEERVQEMLTGTSRKPDELITLQSERQGWKGAVKMKGSPVRFEPMNWTATVEKVAINAVMAGCRPEHLPVGHLFCRKCGGPAAGLERHQRRVRVQEERKRRHGHEHDKWDIRRRVLPGRSPGTSEKRSRGRGQASWCERQARPA